ncbi:MAG TPA: cell division protein DivIVA [Pseudonocardiaceae bacterium]|jgi:cell division septum initiation protein DivIVA|nr:cell division protein DivIVA [Pseudonocardiaceae bacterium]
MARPEDRELVPLKPGFDVVWHGFDRVQVKQYLDDLDAEMKLLSADRDAALSQVSDLTEQLSASHARASELNKQVSGLVELPKNADDLDDRCRRMVQLAHHQAAEITARAQAAATHSWASAEDAAAKLRGNYEKLLNELDKQRQEIRGQHSQIVDQARTTVAEMTTQATKRRHDLDAQAEGRRVKIEDEFERTMTSKRQALAKEIEQQRGASRAEAERRVREATEEAERRVREATERAERKLRETTDECHRRVNEANRRVQDLRGLRQRITQQLHSAHKLMKDATPLLDALEDEQQQLTGNPAAAKATDGTGGQANAGQAGGNKNVPKQRLQQPGAEAGQQGTGRQTANATARKV